MDEKLPDPWDMPAVRAYILDKAHNRLDIARLYYQLMAWDMAERGFWKTINGTIMERYAVSGLKWIKREAWRMVPATAMGE